MQLSSSDLRRDAAVLAGACVCALAAIGPTLGAASASAAEATGADGAHDGSPAAALVQCVTAGSPAERSATFSGEMSAIAGAGRMSMRIEVLERASGEAGFHAVIAPGLGVWSPADAGVKIYKYLKQVANLSAPATYRAAISFRWQGAHGRVVKRAERLTRPCEQPAPAPGGEAQAGAGEGAAGA